MLSAEILQTKVSTVNQDMVCEFGDRSDGAIEFAGLVAGGVIETGYFYGDDKPKNILVLSSQLGCPSKCSFCELGSERFVRNLTAQEIYQQAVLILQIAQRYGIDIDACRHKVNYAKSGEPLLNPNLIESMSLLGSHGFSFKVSTVFPYNKKVAAILKEVARYATTSSEAVQMQISLISTSAEHRRATAGIRVATFAEIRSEAEKWFTIHPNSRKFNLSLMMTEDIPFDYQVIEEYFHPHLFRIRLRMYVPTHNGNSHQLKPATTFTYHRVKEHLEGAGYDTGDWAIPTPMEQRFGLASNVTRRRYLEIIGQ